LLVHLLFLFGAKSLVERFRLCLHLVHLDIVVYLFFHRHVKLGLESLLLKLLVLALKFQLLILHVPTALHHNVGRTFTSFINLANSLQSSLDLNLLLTFPSSDFKSPILLHKSLRSSSALFLAIFAATSFLWRVASSSSSYGVRSISSKGCWSDSGTPFSYVGD
jgi:hypothetical protein